MNLVFDKYIQPLRKFINNRYDECELIVLDACDEEKRSYENTPLDTALDQIEDAVAKRNQDIHLGIQYVLNNVLKDFLQIYKSIMINMIHEKQIVMIPEDFFTSSIDTLYAFYNEFRDYSFNVSVDTLNWEKNKPSSNVYVATNATDQKFTQLTRIIETDLNTLVYHVSDSKKHNEVVLYNVIVNELLNYAINLLTLIYV